MSSFERLNDCCGVTELIELGNITVPQLKNLLGQVESDVIENNDIHESGRNHLCIATLPSYQTVGLKSLKGCGFKRHRKFINASSGNSLEVWSKLITITPPEEDYY